MKVIVHVKINSVKETSKWFLNTCTTCNQVIERTDEFFICASCNRIVPHPDKKYDHHLPNSTVLFSKNKSKQTVCFYLTTGSV